MIDNNKSKTDPSDDPKLTAYVLGELSTDERNHPTKRSMIPLNGSLKTAIVLSVRASRKNGVGDGG